MLPTFTPIAKVTFDGLRVVLTVCKSGGAGDYRLTAQGRGTVQVVSIHDSPPYGLDSPPSGLQAYSGVRVARLGLEGQRYLVVYLATEANSGGVAGVAHVFRFAQHRLEEVGELHSHQMFSVLAMGGGREALARSYEIGGMDHAAMPRWEEFYYVQNDRLTQVTYSPRLYRPWTRSLWQTLLRFPTDDVCWAAYGLAVRRSGAQDPPKDAYARMLRHRRDWEFSEGETVSSINGYLRTHIRGNGWPKAHLNYPDDSP